MGDCKSMKADFDLSPDEEPSKVGVVSYIAALQPALLLAWVVVYVIAGRIRQSHYSQSGGRQGCGVRMVC